MTLMALKGIFRFIRMTKILVSSHIHMKKLHLQETILPKDTGKMSRLHNT